MEARAAAERRAVDDAVDAVTQQRGEQVLDRVQTRGRDFAAVGLDEAHVEIRDLVAFGPASTLMRRTYGAFTAVWSRVKLSTSAIG